ncbi:MAG TPA: flagellar hook protein FlgE [Sphingobium sp.]|uniref:flagellar hook protein FlgE n=1 Tax=Sphingobium sp. TaxID=1912891 RepID=UPI002ED4F2B5
MSLYSALYAGVSGLGAQSTAMATVADNITNVNTVGYKGVTAQFSAMVTGSGSRNSYTAGGVTAAPQALISAQGILQSSARLTDIGMDGAGFFVVRSSTAPDAPIAFTRAGAFAPDKNGYLYNQSTGYFLQGWPLDANGNYVNNGSLDALRPVDINALSGSATATSTLSARINLQNSSPAVTAYTPGDMNSGTVTPAFSRPIDVYDSQGGAHTITLSFTRTGTNEWAMEVSGGGTLLRSGTVAFNGNGSLNLAGSTAGLFDNLTGIDWGNGTDLQTISLGLGSDGGLNGLTQTGEKSTLYSYEANGGLMGDVASVNISESGVVSAVFEDGTIRAIYQLPVATFQNPDGLTAISGNAYVASLDSGTPSINSAGVSGSGKIAAGKLEASTVDLAGEFTNMIRFQRAYSASSKIITTVDEMLQELGNIKR